MFSRTILTMLCLATGGFAQVPPGQPYDRETHPNPIVTFVETADFNTTTYEDAREVGDMDLLGLSAEEGRLEALAISTRRVREVELLGRKTEVLFFPVVLQTFRLGDDSSLDLYSFKNPRLDLPPDMAAAVLDTEAFRTPENPEEGRFGLSNPPERLRIRGGAALLFDNDGERVLFWQENGVSHVAVAPIDREDLFWLVEDFL